jgi:biofilm PGA synthesis N-glycosyltransferase PgaC
MVTRCSIGIMVHNEEANIGNLLRVLLNHRSPSVLIEEIIVVASGCTDNTIEIVKDHQSQSGLIRLLIEETRNGKASAINVFLREAKNQILVLLSGDTLPEEDALSCLVRPFSHKEIGMTGCHPIPVNKCDDFMGFTVQFMWRLHHRLALEDPKLGEMVAFRNMVRQIPDDTAVDEASIEAIITRAGYRLVYVPESIVRNKGAENVKDFLCQRRRIYAGHLWLSKTHDYAVSTKGIRRIFKQLLKELSLNPKTMAWIFGAILLEVYGRLLGLYDFYIRNKNPYIWHIALTTKELSCLRY